VQKRQLTLNFEKSVSEGGTAQVIEVAITPLTEPNNPTDNTILVGGAQVQEVVLNNTVNSIHFMLVPTDLPDLDQRVPYRIAWREKYMGRQFTKDFVMPDFDVNFADLDNLGQILGGETYLQWSDRGRTGGVAPLNDAGQVTDAFGHPVLGQETADSISGAIAAEVVARQQAIAAQQLYLVSYTDGQITSVLTTTASNLNAAVAQLQNADTIERAARQAADTTLGNTLSGFTSATTTHLGTLDSSVAAINVALPSKADLVGGKIPTAQLPNLAIGHAVVVANQAAMLALTDNDVQPGDIAVRPDGNYFLNASPPSVLANWVQLTAAAVISEVNGQTGVVVLGPADVGARSASQPVPLADVSGLQSALDAKTNVTATNTLASRVTTIENDGTIARLVSNMLPKANMPADSAFITSSNLVAKKDGTVLNLSGGGTLTITDVGGLQAALNSKLPANDASVTNARTPTAHAASHLSGGTDALLPIGTTDVSGLSPIITDNELSATSAHGPRVASLETRVENLELGAPGGGLGASGKTIWFSAPSATTDFSTVMLRSPFGFDGSNYSYDPAGVDPSIAVWPYLTPNGHLKFRTRNESAPTDDPVVTQPALDSLAAQVATKASQGTVDSLSSTVATKADSSALDATNAIVATKADQSALNATNTAVAARALQSGLDATNTTVASKANQSALDALSTTVGTKAAASDLTTLTSRVTAVENTKADLSGGTVPLAQLPAYPTSKVTGLDAALAATVNLVGGLVPLAEIPQLPTSRITNLDTTLAAKADLVGGQIPTAQLPALAITDTWPVANRAAMLALTAQKGDVAVITATADQGTYILTTNDPTQFANWQLMVTPSAPVTTVNGQRGDVVLDAVAVGARPSSVLIAQADVSGLPAALAAKADASTTTTALATKTTVADVQAQLSAATPNKQAADLVATTAIASMNGQQSIDGTLTPIGSIVLATAQPSSVNNGLWVVSATAWTRATDMNAGDFFVRGTEVIIKGGTNNHDTIWQQTGPSGVVGTAANNWVKILTAGAPPVYTASTGVQRVGNDFRGVAAAGGGIIVDAQGFKIDPNVGARKVSFDVPPSNPATITHNLGTTDISVSFRDKAAGDAFLAGWKPTGPNTLSAEFDSVPTVGQWRCTVFG
jgi:tryptophanyl-tRNA synthetase